MTEPQRIALPGLTDEDQATLDRLVAQLHARGGRNRLRASYYDGTHVARILGTSIPPQYQSLRMVLGWSAKAVDMLARRVNPDGFVWAGGDLDDLGLPELQDTNHLGAELNSAIVSSLIHGPSFLVTVKGDEAAGEPPVLVIAKDAENATGEWSGRRRRLDNLLSVTDRDKDGTITALTLFLDGVTWTAARDGGRWTAQASEHPWGVPAEMLTYKPRVGRPYGQSRISRTVMSLHDQALRTAVRLEAHMDIYSFPEYWMFGADEQIFKNADGSQKSVWQVMMGRLKGIPDDDGAEHPRADVKQFTASDPEPHLKALKQQAMLFSGETSIPLTSLGVSDMSNPTSAESYMASRDDLIAEAEGTADDFSPALRRTVIRALAIANGRDGVPREWSGIDVKWRSPMHESRAAAADAGSKQLAAVSWLADTEVGLELLGLDAQQIERALADRRRAAGTAALAQIVARAGGDGGGIRA